MSEIKPNPRSLFDRALALDDPAERASYLDQACGGDANLRAEIEALLAAAQQAGSFMQGPAASDRPTSAFDPVSEAAGTVIGPYKLLQKIGEGGMGVVFMAEQTRPVQRMVAMKIIKPGMDSRQVIARFEAERQALALMDHPNIARVLDAGATESGRPYFVMELVKGTAITQYADEHQLTPRARLELFLPVCKAVQHAHQKGIVHRDLKPTNVLVAEYDNHAVPKVIDFGVAKATAQRLTERTMFTEFGQVLGTVEYMSPEQAKLNQLDIDTRTDIYSLGVLLYELLAGDTPFDRQRLRSAAFDEVLRIIREEEPPRPSTRLSSSDALPSIAARRQLEPAKLTKLIRGELDWIVMKALDKDRNRRYETANALAQEVERFLSDEPVQACPPSSWYRLRKVVRRNKLAVGAGAAVTAALVIGIVVAAFFAVLASRQAVQARRSAAIAQSEKKRADGAAGVAARRREQAQRTLCRSLYDQAQLLQKSSQVGRRWASLDLLRQADRLKERIRASATAGESDAADLPTDAELRSAAVAALLTEDARRVREIKITDFESGMAGYQTALSADGWMAVGVAKYAATEKRTARLGMVVLDLAKLHYAQEHLRKIPVLPQCFALSPDGKVLAVQQFNRVGVEVKLWDMPWMRAEPRVLVWKGFEPTERDDPSYQLVFDPGGERLALVRYGYNEADVVLWEIETGQEKSRRVDVEAGGDWGPAAFTPDGKLLAIRTGQKRMKLLHLEKGAAADRDVTLPLRFTREVSFSSNQPLVAVHIDDLTDANIVVWDYQQNVERARIPGNEHHCAAFRPDGKRLAVGDNRGISIYELPDLNRIVRLQRVAVNVIRLQWSSDGARLFSVDMMGALQVWELNPAAPLVGVPLEGGPAKSFTFSPDGHWIGAVDDDSARLIDRATGRTERHYEHGRMMCFDARSQRVAIVSDNRQPVVIEDVQSGKELWQKYVPETQTICYDANFDPQGELLVASGCWEKCRVWKPATDETVWEDPVEVSYPIPDFSDDGRTMSVVSADSQRSASEVFLWELPSGRKITQFKCADYVLQCEVSPNHRWAAITSTRLLADRTFKLTEKTRLATTGIHADRPKPLSTVTVLRLPEGSKHATIEFGAGVTMVSFNPHDGLLACTTEDGMVHLWRLDESAEILRLKPPRKPERAAATFTPDGRCLAWCSQRGRGQAMPSTMHFLDLPELQRQLTNIGFGW